MLNRHVWCVIMAGGNGTRFWPVSTVKIPKQFIPVGDTGISGGGAANGTFLGMALRRFEGLVPLERTVVVTNRRHSALVHECLPELPQTNILEEPYNRDTAPCVALAAYSILKRDPDAVMVVVPSDHLILDTDRFRDVISTVSEYIRQNDVLLTIGITPTRPDTNYGYIQTEGTPVADTPIKVKTFTEKPDAELAEVFVQSGEFLWNSGIFVWKADTIRAEIQRYMPQLAAQFKGWEGALGTQAEPVFLSKAYADIQKISIDYAIMERTAKAWVYPADFGWYDLGTWESLYSFFPGKDADGNACKAAGRLLRGCRDNLVLTTNPDKLVAVCGLEGYVVVDTGSTLMICPKDDRKIRDFLSNLALPEYQKYR